MHNLALSITSEQIIKIQLVRYLKSSEKNFRFNGVPCEALSLTVSLQIDSKYFELIYLKKRYEFDLIFPGYLICEATGIA